MFAPCTRIARLRNLAAGVSLIIAPGFTAAQVPVSVCVVAEDGCDVLGSKVDIALELGQVDAVIVGGQFSIVYDSGALQFVDIKPGSTCAPASPFNIESTRSIDEEAGEITYAVAVTPGEVGTQGPATMACLSFVVLGSSTAGVCLSDDADSTFVVNDLGNHVPIDDVEVCPADPLLQAISCDGVEIDASCQCEGATPDCSLWDDECNVGICNEATNRCEPVPVNEGEPCDDGYECTVTDTCVDGVCVGSGCTNPSVCVEAEEGCYAFPGANLRIELGDSDAVIAGGQFSIRYDPEVLTFGDISPGSTCNPASPFALEIFETVDEVNGEIFYAVGVNPFEQDPGARGATTMACLSFSASATVESQVCLFDGVHPLNALLVDEFGTAVSIYNLQACGTDLALPTLSCDDVAVDENCVCRSGTADCGGLTNDCRAGVCNEETGRCDTVPINEGGPCDDAESCTVLDTCEEGECVGVGCKNPSLCVVAQETCVIPGDVFPEANIGKVAIRLGAGDPLILGGQFSIQYDPTALDLLDISPGRTCDGTSPFVTEFYETVDEVNGEIFYAVTVTPETTGTRGPATMACLTFAVYGPSEDGICLSYGQNPLNTLLVSQAGQSITIHNARDCPGSRPLPIISCDQLCIPIPTVSGWGLALLTLLLLTVAKICFGTASLLGQYQSEECSSTDWLRMSVARVRRRDVVTKHVSDTEAQDQQSADGAEPSRDHEARSSGEEQCGSMRPQGG